ncbi:FtsK/SpoIIIE domain-containing protein, partial [Streptomyces sp. NPDC006510]|uniref:FtsK/SpoIIIE domain-containing protein n=1 Tax=Streptomyces sp. NPDC006510 TaxID=3155600 RepID=UPI0033AFC840
GTGWAPSVPGCCRSTRGGPAAGGTDHGADPDTHGSGRTEYPRGAGPRVGAQRAGGAPGPDGTGGYAPGSGRTPYPGSESATHIGTPGRTLAVDEAHDSGRTPYPDSGRTPYPSGSVPRVGGQRYVSAPGDTPSSRTVPGTGTGPWGSATDRGGDVQGADSLRSTGSGRGSNRVSGPRGSDTPRIAARGAQSAAEAGRTAVEATAGTDADAGTGTPAPAVAPASSSAEGTVPAAVGRPVVVLGAGPRGSVSVDLAEEGPHLLIEGPAGSGRTELLRAVAASLAAAARPDRLGILLVDGAGGDRGEGLRPCTELPHAFMHLVASDPVRMREFAQALGGELKRRAELLGQYDFTEWHHRHEVARRVVGQRPPVTAEQRGDVDTPMSGTLRLRPTARSSDSGPSPLPRLVVLVDDFDALVAPALGSPGRPAAGSVVRALEAVAREGGRLGVHLVAASARPERTEDTDLAHGARLRIVLDAPVVAPSPEDPAPGRGRLGHPDGRVTPFQGGRVTGRIPRTATLRPTVVPLEWERMGDPPTRRPVRELGNGPTDLALLASALERAARSVNAEPIAPLGPVHS